MEEKNTNRRIVSYITNIIGTLQNMTLLSGYYFSITSIQLQIRLASLIIQYLEQSSMFLQWIPYGYTFLLIIFWYLLLDSSKSEDNIHGHVNVFLGEH